jgi:hypothetical protein
MAYLSDIERLNYYEGEYLGALDFQAEQEYHRDMRRRHNLGQHTWGIVTGLELAQAPNGNTNPSGTNEVDVYLQPGMAVDGFGREIVALSQSQLTTAMLAAYYDPNANASPVLMYVWIGYQQSLLQPPSDACANMNVSNAYGRIQETYTLTVTQNDSPPSATPLVVVSGISTAPPAPPSSPPSSPPPLPDPPPIVLPQDNSVPYQEFSTDDTTLIWWLPLGCVLWDAHNQVFLQITAAAQGSSAANMGREYVGNVSQITYAPNGSYTIVDRNSYPPPVPASGADPNISGVRAEVAGTLQVDYLLNAQLTAVIGGPYTASKVALSPLTILATSSPTGDAPAVNQELIQFRDSGNNETWHICQNLGGNTPGLNFGEIVSGSPLEGVLFLANGGKAGFGTTSPSQNLSVYGGMNVDAGDNNPGGQLTPNAANEVLTFGKASGEGVGSCRVLGNPNHSGLDFYTAWYPRMSINNTGAVSIGTPPATPLTPAPQLGTLSILGNRTYLIGADGSYNHWIMAGGSAEPQCNAIGFNTQLNQVIIGGDWVFKISNGGLTVGNGDVTIGNGNVTISNGSLTLANGDLTLSNGTLHAPHKVGCVEDRFINRDGSNLQRGDVVVLHSASSEHYYGRNSEIPLIEVQLTDSPMDTRVCGIVDEPSLADSQLSDLDRSKLGKARIGLMVTLGAYAFCKVNADIAPIAPGDLLTTSPTPGHAQKLDTGQSSSPGIVIAKALGARNSGKGLIPVLVSHQ